MVEPVLATLNSFFSNSSSASRSSFAQAARCLSLHAAPSSSATKTTLSSRLKRGNGKGKEKALPECDWAQNSQWLWDARCKTHRPAPSSAPPRPSSAIGANTSHPPNLSFCASSTRGFPSNFVPSQARHASTSARMAPAPLQTPDPHPADVLDRFLHGLPLEGQEDLITLPQAWKAFALLRDSKSPITARNETVFCFIDRAIPILLPISQSDLRKDKDFANHWVDRLQQLLQEAHATTPPGSAGDTRRLCLYARVLSLKADFTSASLRFHQVTEVQKGVLPSADAVMMYDTMLRSMVHHCSTDEVLTFIVNHWHTIGKALLDPACGFRDDGAPFRPLIASLFPLADGIEYPTAHVSARRDPEEREAQVRTGELLMSLFIRKGVPQDAVAICDELEFQGLKPNLFLRLSLVSALARDKAYGLANRQFWGLSPFVERSHDERLTGVYLATAIHLFALQGDTVRTEELFQRIERRGHVRPSIIAMRLHSYGVKGDKDTAVQLFHHHFPDESAERPNIFHYTSVVLAFARSHDLEGVQEWLKRMSQDGVNPDRYVYDIVLQSFALRGEMDVVASLMDEMRMAGIYPRVVTYTNVIAMLAQRRDPVAAEAIFKRAIEEKVVPDRHMVNALMNAHVEAGSWKGVIRAFDYMTNALPRQMRPQIDVYNTLLKAYVLTGTPFRVVSEVFRTLEATGLRPTTHTYSLLIQSACDSGLMDIASGLFRKLDRLSESRESGFSMNAYALTILMAGYLRQGNKDKAKAVYDDMLARNIQPKSATFSAILDSYSNEGTQESLQVAQDFLNSIMSTPEEERAWLDSGETRLVGYQRIYAPLMSSFARRAQPAEVERLFQEFLDAGGEATLGSLTLLLNAYRNAGDIDSLLQVWDEIVAMGLRYSDVAPLFQGSNPRPRLDLQRQVNILCVPLSIYMDALSSVGRHADVADTWQSLKSHGFAFDSHNWNHLTVVLIRAGEPLRAFQILERVILPYQQQSEHAVTDRPLAPSSPLVFDDEPPLAERDPDEVSVGRPARATAKRRASFTILARRNAPADLGMDPDRPNDFAHPLHILHQISPAWNMWRPHSATVSLLMSVLEHLESGRMIQPVASRDGPPQPPQWDGPEQEGEEAGKVLESIHKECPDAVAMVERLYAMIKEREAYIQELGDR
ncbi:hypothetical protein OF83DRAFT_1238574 [Amylostereum chailletii]|nr:hypothetical protein OF83DRAFT_1238574 [Amylostereum chailletii]